MNASASSSSRGLPTPTARDWKGDGYSGQLPNALRLLPTPRTSDTNGAGERGTGGPDLRTAVARLDTSSACSPNSPTTPKLLPTPRATDGEKGGPNQRGSSGDLTLPSAAAKLLPTPTANDAKDGANFRPDGTPYGSGYGMTLTDAARLLPTPRARDWKGRDPNPRGPDLNEAVALLPTPTASDGDRTSETYGRGNPTLSGASTNPRSADGKRSSADPTPGQLTIEDV